VKLAGAGDGPSSVGKAIGLALAGLVVLVLGGILAFSTVSHPSILTAVGFLVMLGAAFIPSIGWRSLGNSLLAYAFAARIPALLVMLVAMLGNGGQGWGTHYDVAPPGFPAQSFATKFFDLAFLPQMTLWIGWTVVFGAILGGIVAALSRRAKPVVATAA